MFPCPRSTCNRTQKQLCTLQQRHIFSYSNSGLSCGSFSHFNLPPGPQWERLYAPQQSLVGDVDSGSVSGFITTMASAREEAKTLQQPWIHSAESSHQKHLFCFTDSNLLSAFENMQLWCLPEPRLWLVFESWRTQGVSQRGSVLERIRLISLSHWFSLDPVINV